MNRLFYSFCAFLASVLFLQNAQAQFVFFHNAPDTLLRSVRVQIEGVGSGSVQYANSNLFSIPEDVTCNIIVRNQADSVLLTVEGVELSAGRLYHGYLTGLSSTEDYLPNPSGSEQSLGLRIVDVSALPAPAALETRVIFVHGGPDLPTVKVSRFPGEIFVESLEFGQAAAVIFPATNTNINFLLEDSTLLLATYSLTLQGRAGQTVVVQLSGFLSPLNNRNGPAFTPLLFAPGLTSGNPLPNVTTVEDFSASVASVNLYPNPNRGQFRLDMDVLQAGNYHLNILDMSGRNVFSALQQFDAPGLQNVQVNTSELANGMYMLSISHEDRQKAIPFIVSK